MSDFFCTALITAAGSSSRMKTGKKKEYEELNGLPVLLWSLKAFRQLKNISWIVITVPEGHEEIVYTMLAKHKLDSQVLIIPGGMVRQDSVRRGLQALKKLNPDYILIHDGARPWVKPGLIETVLAKTKEYGACIPALPVSEALVETKESNWVGNYLERKNIFSVQTPQGFIYRDILEAHLEAEKIPTDFYDDAQVYLLLGKPVFMVKGDLQNKKITFKEDLAITCE